MRILYVPIDERPCNTDIVERIAGSAVDIELNLPPKELMGFKKRPAETELIWEWINNQAGKSDALILSMDMLIYGGILPSRIHYLSEEMGQRWVERLRLFHKEFPDLPIYASNLIMRTPGYSSSDEEPDYYEDWGRDIFLRAYLTDKKQHKQLSQEEKEQLHDAEIRLPEKFMKDYETRRNFNLQMNERILQLASEGVFSFLVIPQDDSAEYGYTAMDQRVITSKIERMRMYNNVYIYPGADEIGATLLARTYNDLLGLAPTVYPIWSSTQGPQLIPLYEDRPFMESMKAHLLSAGCQLADNPGSADLILAYNTPGQVMQESWEQSEKDITYATFRNLMLFVNRIQNFLEQGKNVIVADSAYANGGDSELITLMDEACILDRLLSYKGWNTNCNTLGTTISQGIIGQHGDKKKIQENIIYHLLDDYFYQAEVRMQMTEDFLPMQQLNYFDLKDKTKLVNKERDWRILNAFDKKIKHSFHQMTIKKMRTFAPWNRMFECGIELKVTYS